MVYSQWSCLVDASDSDEDDVKGDSESRRSLLQFALHTRSLTMRSPKHLTVSSQLQTRHDFIFWRLYYCNYLPSFSAAGLMKGTMRLSGESTGEWQLWQDWIWKRQRISRLFPLYLFPFLVFLAWLLNRTCCDKIIIKSRGEGWRGGRGGGDLIERKLITKIMV